MFPVCKNYHMLILSTCISYSGVFEMLFDLDTSNDDELPNLTDALSSVSEESAGSR